ncbi:MAG: sialate O-acetylesterase [Clostridia bacterium]|nr:sialate O-acetylesterase [Clostridia bacterium]
MIHSFLLVGQSNMAGRGFLGEVEPINNDKIKVLRNGCFKPMYVPVNPDRVTSGINLAESFADMYAKEKGVEVGLIPCADGGTSVDQWQEGELLFDHACYMAELASRTSTIAGILWHQGENDCRDELYPSYEPKLLKVIEAFKRRLNLYDVPFILGGLGDFLPEHPEIELYSWLNNYVYINEKIKNVAASTEMVGFASAEGLTSNPDKVHFNSKSLREFGLRYYNEFKRLEKADKVFSEKQSADNVLKSGFENL